MSEPLIPVLTNVGLAAIANAQGTGLQAVISEVAIGRGSLVGGVYKGYTPARTATALVGQMVRVPILSGARRDPAGFTVLSLLPATPGEYPINEVGFYLSNGTLLALWSDPNFPLAYKTPLASVELGFDLLLEAIPTSALAITVLMPDVPDTAGVLAELLATDARAFVNMVNLTLKLASLGVKV
ncbi:phage tail-collar fiber domain-containing protein [Methylobacterium iners]|uniref:Phage tail fibre protein N-terminal domain-containing protein n=1 Tax=Methylobacterium iners TaxID=418707 RepID=A0ABQ4RUP9_9HYPH|nr:phage tail protein [Methylobacterium iners]GJD93342.1 hypothetical protein OCOJLMKI_0535 [Methylobacterium iners]